jgi:hypothetical protein
MNVTSFTAFWTAITIIMLTQSNCVAQIVTVDTIKYHHGLSLVRTTFDVENRPIKIETLANASSDGPVVFYSYGKSSTIRTVGYQQNGVKVGHWKVAVKKRRKWLVIGEETYSEKGISIQGTGYDEKGRIRSERSCNGARGNCIYRHFDKKGKMVYEGVVERAIPSNY